MELPKRKPNRLSFYDYDREGAYFITICTQDRKCMLSKIVGDDALGVPENRLTDKGRIVDKFIRSGNQMDRITVEKYVIMPNHIHGIFIVSESEEKGLKDLSIILGQYKMSVTKIIRTMEPERIVWQRSFHDHVIRNQKSYEKIWTYIENNPLKWEEDCFFVELF